MAVGDRRSSTVAREAVIALGAALSRRTQQTTRRWLRSRARTIRPGSQRHATSTVKADRARERRELARSGDGDRDARPHARPDRRPDARRCAERSGAFRSRGGRAQGLRRGCARAADGGRADGGAQRARGIALDGAGPLAVGGRDGSARRHARGAPRPVDRRSPRRDARLRARGSSERRSRSGALRASCGPKGGGRGRQRAP